MSLILRAQIAQSVRLASPGKHVTEILTTVVDKLVVEMEDVSME